MLWNETDDSTVWHLSSSHLSCDVIASASVLY